MQEKLDTPAVSDEERRVAQASVAAADGLLETLHHSIGNRAVGRMLRSGDPRAGRLVARQPITNVEVKKRFEVPIRGYSQEQVRALYLGQGIVYSGDAVWHEKSASWIVDRSQIISMREGAGKGSADGGGGGIGLPTKEDVERFEATLESILLSEELPPEGTIYTHDDFSTAHMNAVKAVINFYMLKAYYATLDETGSPTATVIEVVKKAGSLLTAHRGESSLRSQSLILRDAQRYFYGRVAAWSNVDAMKAKSFSGISPKVAWDALSEAERAKGKESVFLDEPDTTNIEKMKEMQSGYESLKQITKFFGGDISATEFPTSAPGARYWLHKGADDSYNDISRRTYTVKTVPYLVK